MRFRISPRFFEKFPEAWVGVLVARDLDNRGEEGALVDLVRAAQEDLLERIHGGVLTEHPRIACWREAYRAFGAKPKKHPSSIESLARRSLKGEPLRSINKLVDLYNTISLRHLLPAGGEDLEKVQGDIELTLAGDGEAPVRLLGEREERAPRAGEVIYRDEVGSICRRWNWKEAERTKLTEETRHAVLVIESLPPVEPRELDAALEELAGLVLHHCGGTVTRYVLHRLATDVNLM